MIVLALLACMPEPDVLSHYDRDGDGFLHPEAAAQGVDGPFDCDDAAAAIHPDAAEVCDGLDNDCDDAIDDGDAAPTIFFVDDDGDGFGGEATAQGCEITAGQATVGGDCDDTASAVFPGAEEVWYDGVDQDCLGGDDFDADLDGHRADDHGGTDCEDDDPAAYEGAPEGWYDVGTDNDCDGSLQDQVVLDPGTTHVIEGNGSKSEFGASIIEIPAGWLDAAPVVLITAPAEDDFRGSAYAWKASDLATASSASDAQWHWSGLNETNSLGDLLGYSAAWAGDSARPVLVLGAPGTSETRGSVYGWVEDAIGDGVDAATFQIDGDATGTYTGGRMVSGADLDGDGLAEIVVQAILDSRVAANAGTTGVFYSASELSGAVSYADADVILTIDEPAATMIPWPLGDADDDGRDDLTLEFEALAYPKPEGAVLVDVPAFGLVDVPSAAMALTYHCRPGAITDLDGDGTAELLALGGAVFQFDLTGGGALVPDESAVASSGFGDEVASPVTWVNPSIPYWDGSRRVLAASWLSSEETGAVALATLGWGVETNYSDARFLVLGDRPGDRLGMASAVLDGNADGVLDILLGAPGFDGASSGSGAVYVIPGPR